MKKKEVVGIDVSKLTIDAYIELAEVHAVFDNSTRGFKRLVKWIKKHIDCQLEELLVCFEITGLYSLQLASFLGQNNIDFVMENPIQIKRSMGMVRGKDDKVDSKRIAEYAYLRKEKLKLTTLPSDDLIKVQNLPSLRDRMVKQKAGYQASLGEYKRVLEQQQAKDFFKMLKNMISVLKKQITKAEKALLEIINSNQDLMKTYVLLTSIKGIGSPG